MKWDYSSIKARARARGLRAQDYLALASVNDPFYVGTPADIDRAEWFAGLFSRFGFTQGVHLRRIHYRIVSEAEPVILPDGTPYENTAECWNAIGVASKAARYLGLVDPAAFDDRRNPEPVVYAPGHPGRPAVCVDEADAVARQAIPRRLALPALFVEGYDPAQPYHLEIWAEKTTMNDVLMPLCERYGVTLVTGAGELSITSVCLLLERARQSGRPVRIFYVSDFNPAGRSMPVAVSRKIEFFARNKTPGLDLDLFAAVLTSEQVAGYDLPRTPIKASERRRESFEQRHGSGATELDALEALRPGELKSILERHILRYHDETLDERTAEAESEAEDLASQATRRVHDHHRERIDELDARYQELVAQIEQVEEEAESLRQPKAKFRGDWRHRSHAIR